MTTFGNRQEFIDGIYEYVKTHEFYGYWDKEDAIINTLSLLVSDIGAAQSFLYAIGVDLDLYTYDFQKAE
jgi:hypothetical protein